MTWPIRRSISVSCTLRDDVGALAVGDVVGVTQRPDVDEGDRAAVEVLHHLLVGPGGVLLDPPVAAGPAGRGERLHGLDADRAEGRRVAEQAEPGVEAFVGGGREVGRPLQHRAVGHGRGVRAGPVRGVGCGPRSRRGGPGARRHPEPAVDRAGVGVDRAHRQRRGGSVAQQLPEVRGGLLVDVGPADAAGADEHDRTGRLVRRVLRWAHVDGRDEEPRDHGRQGDRQREGSAQHGARLRGRRHGARISGFSGFPQDRVRWPPRGAGAAEPSGPPRMVP